MKSEQEVKDICKELIRRWAIKALEVIIAPESSDKESALQMQEAFRDFCITEGITSPQDKALRSNILLRALVVIKETIEQVQLRKAEQEEKCQPIRLEKEL